MRSKGEIAVEVGYYKLVLEYFNPNQTGIHLFRFCEAHYLLLELGVETMRIPVVQMARSREGKQEPVKSYSDCRPLPPSYMSEYSVLGFIVDKLEKAIETLARNGFWITREVFGAEVEIGDPARVPAVVDMLFSVGVYCSIGDVIDSVYQG